MSRHSDFEKAVKELGLDKSSNKGKSMMGESSTSFNKMVRELDNSFKDDASRPKSQ